jgi:hypothetical protein
MQQPEERWQQLVGQVGLANATRLIMTESPGQGDSVKDLDGIWEGMSVFQIYETILAEKSPRPAVPVTAGLWGHVRAGENARIPIPWLMEAPPAVTCNSLPELQ